MRKVIINADDFGISEAFNHGVIKGYCDGIVSSTTIMINMPTAEHAIKLASNYNDLFIGLHVNFVLGKPCSDISKIASMVDKNGDFYRSKDYRSGKRKFDYEEAKIETIAQMERFKELLGYYPEHIEGHVSKSEAVNRAFIDVAKEFKIHTSAAFRMKNTKEKCEGYTDIILPDPLVHGEIINKGLTVDNFLNDDLKILKEKKDGVIELHFHPGYLDEFILKNSSLTLPRCHDLGTLCDPRVKGWIKENNIELVSFKDLKL